MSHQVVSFLKRRQPGGEVLVEEPLDLPERTLRTTAVWWTVPDDVVAEAGLATLDVPGAAHAAEHCSIGLLPLFATCDRWDIGGVSTARHADTGVLTVFVYDGHPGGAGFSERGFRTAVAWLTATREAIASCECASGLPVVHPVAQVRQPEQPPRQGRRDPAARRPPRGCTARGRLGLHSAPWSSSVSGSSSSAASPCSPPSSSASRAAAGSSWASTSPPSSPSSSGVAAGAAILWGFAILKWGTKRSLAHRTERKELTELNEKLERVEAERRTDDPERRDTI